MSIWDPGTSNILYPWLTGEGENYNLTEFVPIGKRKKPEQSNMLQKCSLVCNQREKI